MAETSLLYVVRHGTTDANEARRYAGWSDHRLNERGREQAAGLAARLAGEGIRRIYTSPVRRCVQTAEIVAEPWDAAVRTVHDLHEIEVGPWKGLTVDEVAERWPEVYRQFVEDPSVLTLQGRERLEEVRERALQAVDQIGHAQLSAEDAPALVMTHLAVIRVLWLSAGGRPLSEYHRVYGPFCRPFPIRWLGRGRLEPAGPAPDAPRDPAADPTARTPGEAPDGEPDRRPPEGAPGGET